MYSYSRTSLFLFLFLSGSSALEVEAHHLSSQPTQTKYQKAASRTEHALQKYDHDVSQAYEKYRKNTAQVWGKDALIPNAKTDVTYRDNYKQRSVIDFEKGKVKVELAVKSDADDNQENVKHKMAHAVEQTLLQPPDDRSIIDIADHPDPPPSDKPPELEDLVADIHGIPLTRDHFEKFKREKTRHLDHRIIIGRDGKKRIVYSTHFDLVPDHIKRRAKRFRRAVDRNATLRRIPAPLIYAIIETESFFNPRARSPVPAFGLMQLVPATGARDAYKFLYAKDRVVKDRYLYNPNNNIKLGTAYLHILYFRYFNQIKDPRSRTWATIAAYNGGVNNVIRSLVGDFDDTNHAARWIWEKRAVDKLNTMRSEQVFHYFCNNMPSEETRNYIRKVRQRMGKYQI